MTFNRERIRPAYGSDREQVYNDLFIDDYAEEARGRWKTVKDFVPYIRYVDPDERERFLGMTQQQQTRELLLQNLGAVLELGGVGAGIQGVKKIASPVFRKLFPKTTRNVAKNAEKIAASQMEPKAPKYAGSVNTARQSIRNEAKRLEYELWEEKGLKTTISQDELVTKANKIYEKFKADPKYYQTRIEKIKAGQTPTIEEEIAHRVMNAHKFDNFVDVVQQVNKGELAPDAYVKMQRELEQQFFEVANPLAADAGRRLASYNIEVGKNRAFKAISQLGKNLNKRQMKELAEVNWEDPFSVGEFIKRLPNPRLKDYLYEYWYNSILSGIPTHMVNVASNTGWFAFQLPHRALTGAVDKVVTTFTGKARTRYMSEVVPMMAGVIPGAKRGVIGAYDMLRHGRLTKYETKWAAEIGGAMGAFDRSPSKFVRGVGKLITPPTKALRAMDVFGNSVAYDSQIRALAKRAWLGGKRRIDGTEFKDYKSFRKSFMSNPPEAAHKEAMEFAKYTTFMSDPGKFSTGIMAARDAIPGGRLVVPFVNTIGNLLKRGVEMTPGVGLALSKGQNASEVIAKQIEGSILAFLLLDKAQKGEITGAPPENMYEREAFYRQGKKPWAIKQGDEWYQVRRIEPFNTVFASVAIANEHLKHAKDEDEATEIFLQVANDMKNNVIDSSYLQGVSQVLNRHGSAKGMVQRSVAGFVPYSGFFRSINRSYEVATQGNAKLRKNDSWLGAFSLVIPGLSEKSPAELNVWGEEIKLEGGILRQWLPYKWSTQTEDKTELALEKIGLYPGHPQNVFTYKGKKYKFDDDVYRDYLITYGHSAKRKLDRFFSKPNVNRALNDITKHPRIIDDIENKLTKDRNYFRKKAIQMQLQKGLSEPIQ